jgi:pSer/pThr/pTyr-binding forkhead associated (FHA) protein
VSKHQKPRDTEARLRILLPTGDTFKHVVTGTESRIGTGSQSDILIVDPEVSSTHAILRSNGGGYIIVDEGGVGGTSVNGEKVTEPRKLSNGDVIGLGKSQITFKLKHADKSKGNKADKARLAETASSDVAVEAEVRLNNGASEGEKSEKLKKHKKDKHKAKLDIQADSVIEAKTEVGAAPNNGESEAEKKKKKDKQKGKVSENERIKAARVRAWGGIIATVLSVVLTVTISIIVTRTSGGQPNVVGAIGGTQLSKKLANLSDSSKISGGKFEASGAVAVPDANGILFVDDSKADQVLYMPVNQLGEQDGPVKAIPLGVSVENPEGITQFGSRFVIIGSLSTPESNDKGGVAVFDFDSVTKSVSKTVALTGMRRFLFDNVPELKAWADKSGVEGGLNIEGIAVDPDPQHPRILLGLRGPVLNGNALVVPIKVLDRRAPLTLENLAMDEPNAIQLNLNGQAIRDIQYDSFLRAFLIISGAPETEKKADFTLWEWTGDGNQTREPSRPKLQAALDPDMKPEGVTHLKILNYEFVFIVGDASRYAKIDYLTP